MDMDKSGRCSGSSDCIANALGDKGGKTVRLLEVRLTGGRSEYVRGVREPHLLAVLPSAFSYWRYSSGGI